MKGHTLLDLVVLVADKDMQQTMQMLLARTDALGTGAFRFEVFAHPQHDPAVRTQAAQFLRPLQQNYRKALVVFDHEGSGADHEPAVKIESDAEELLSRNGWEQRCRVVVLEPELENWVWASSRNVDRILGWEGRIPELRQWLVENGFVESMTSKPSRPKEAMEAAMRHSGKRWSSSIFRSLAEHVAFADCTERAFCRLRETLRNWFAVR